MNPERFPKTMTPKMSNRLVSTSVVALALALAAPALAQSPTPDPSPQASPQPSPSPAPATPVTVDSPMAPVTVDDVDAARIEAEVERALALARKDIENGRRVDERRRALIEREARRAATRMAQVTVNPARIDAEVRAAIEKARRASYVDRDEAAREAAEEAWEAEREAREAAKEAEQEAREQAREAEQEAREAAREAEQEAKEAEREAKERAREAEQEAREAAREAEEEARERAREAAREAEEEAREAGQDSREKAKEKEQEAREKAKEKAEQDREKAREKNEEARERAREKAQEAREREQERRDRDQERREAERDRKRDESDRVDDLYDSAMEAIDEENWSSSLRPLSRLMALNTRVDAALYWTAYAQGKMSRTAAALESLARLQKEFPTSRWAKEGKALEMEVRGKSGQTPRPDQEEDLDLKLMAVSALAQSDPQEAMPLLAKILNSPASPRKVRERSLFVLAQIGSEQASAAIAEVARGNSSPELQRKAIQYLGVFGGPTNRKVLSEVYASNVDNTIRKQILNSFMVSGDKARVLNAAKTEKDPALRADAIRLLGVMGGSAELSQMYSTATTADEKKDILHALFIGGAVEPVAAAARGEKDKEVRRAAVRNLGLMGRKSQDVLSELYRAEADYEVKKEILNAFFLQANSVRLIEIARVEKDPGLKKDAVHWLSLMNSKESRAYMMELLKD
jgi:hypothetical protein